MSRSKEAHRRLDFWLGVPLIALLACVRIRRPMPVSPRKIGIISPTAIGDLILETGVLLHIRETFPAAEIFLFHGKTNAGVIPLLPVQVEARECNFTNFSAALSALKGAQLDILVDLTPWPRLTALCAALSGAFTVGFRSERQLRHYAFDVAVSHLRTRHETANLQSLASVFAPCPEYRVRLRNDLAKPSLPLPYDRFVLCHVSPGGSRAQAKSWPNSHWVDLVRQLAREGFVVGFTGAKSDAEKISALLAETRLSSGSAFSLCGQLSLVELAGMLLAARLLITVDTGVLHLASALNTPVIGLHGPTRSERWGALSSNAISLNAPHPERGFIHLGFEKSPHEDDIMRTLSVDTVLEAAKRALSRHPQS